IPAMDGSIALGALLIVTGAALRLWAIITLGRFFSARVALQEQHRLVREGPYRWIRHPSYTGALLLLLGAPLLLQTPVSLGIAATALGIAYFRRITAEEALLRTHFGNAFECYERETKRLIPLLW
ncbi:MAG: isoprenylcysteine carboxylmethyltransferase family protein, partial [Myxococcales bacterium]|nr:isoprenylcysteine carboxylmethyltransferase family protein [Myxococcales bacterium]